MADFWRFRLGRPRKWSGGTDPQRLPAGRRGDGMADDPQQGPGAGTKWPAEVESYVDPNTGARVRRIANDPGARDRHLYFTTDGWYDGGRRLLLRSRREGRWNLFSVDLETGVLTQLTDLPGGVRGSTRVNDATGEVYFGHDDRIVGLDVWDRSVRTVLERPDGYDGYGFGVDDVLADDEHLLASVSERVDVEGFDEHRAARPHSAIFVASIEGGDCRRVHEEDRWISHVNASPARAELFTYCHEGPWDHVDNRIHVVNLDADENYRLRAAEDEAVGHEYWLRDGEHVGYHGWRGPRDSGEYFHGTIRYDDADRRETPIPVRSTHCHSNGRERFVCDGGTELQHLLLFDEGDEASPRKLATHAWDADSPHPHSRLSPDGATVAFDADPGGEAGVFLVDVPEVEELPPLDPGAGS